MLKLKDIALMSMMLAILIVCSKIKFSIGPIPITLQTFAVIIISYILGVKKGLIVFGLYIFIGVVCFLPVFSGTDAGFYYVLKPSFGFIIGFFLSAIPCGIKIKDDSLIFLIIRALLGLATIDIVGLIYMGIIFNCYMGASKSFSYIIEVGLSQFLIKDILSVFICALVYDRIRPSIERYNQAR